jgi:excisionase family DNA binding protein
MNSDLFTVRESAPKIRVSISTLRRMILNRQIGYKRIGKMYYFSSSNLQDYLDRAEVLPITEAKTATMGGN